MPRKPDVSVRRIQYSSSAGFTLVEVLLAILITAFVGVLAYNGLTTAINVAQGHQAVSERLAEIQLPLRVLERDIRHAVKRPVRDEYGDLLPAFSGGEFDDYLLRLTRAGWDNPRGLPRGELQRVRYQYLERSLWRESWSVLDRVDEEASQRRVLLLEGIEAITVTFLDRGSSRAAGSALGGEWIEEWSGTERLPAAVQVTLEIEGLGEVRRVFAIPQL